MWCRKGNFKEKTAHFSILQRRRIAVPWQRAPTEGARPVWMCLVYVVRFLQYIYKYYCNLKIRKKFIKYRYLSEFWVWNDSVTRREFKVILNDYVLCGYATLSICEWDIDEISVSHCAILSFVLYICVFLVLHIFNYSHISVTLDHQSHIIFKLLLNG